MCLPPEAAGRFLREPEKAVWYFSMSFLAKSEPGSLSDDIYYVCVADISNKRWTSDFGESVYPVVVTNKPSKNSQVCDKAIGMNWNPGQSSEHEVIHSLSLQVCFRPVNPVHALFSHTAASPTPPTLGPLQPVMVLSPLTPSGNSRRALV